MSDHISRDHFLLRAANATRHGELTCAGWATLGLRLTQDEAEAVGFDDAQLGELTQLRTLVGDEHTFSPADHRLRPVRILLALSSGELTPAGLEMLGSSLPHELLDEIEALSLRRELVERGLVGLPPAGTPQIGFVGRPGTALGVGPVRAARASRAANSNAPSPLSLGRASVASTELSPGRASTQTMGSDGSGLADSEDIPLLETTGYERTDAPDKGET